MTDGAGQAAVAVVVATHDRALLLPRLVAALERQQGAPAFEVLVVDDASGDETWPVLQELARTTTVRLRPMRLAENRGPAAARNLGWRASSAPLIAFTDDDCTPQPGWLAALQEAAQGADIVQGRTEPDPAQLARSGPFSRTLAIDSEDGFYQTCNIAYHRRWLERLGGFDEDFRHPAGEDTELAWRAVASGARTTFSASAVVRHDVRPSSLRAQLRDTPRWGSVVLAVRKHPPLRNRLHSRHFWRASHPPALLAVAGLGIGTAALAGSGRARLVAAMAAAALVAPYARFRTVTAPLPGLGPRRRVALLPAALLTDAAEVAVCAAASVRHRRLVL